MRRRDGSATEYIWTRINSKKIRMPLNSITRLIAQTETIHTQPYASRDFFLSGKDSRLGGRKGGSGKRRRASGGIEQLRSARLGWTGLDWEGREETGKDAGCARRERRLSGWPYESGRAVSAASAEPEYGIFGRRREGVCTQAAAGDGFAEA